jgi:hypothetical protein
MMDDGSMGNAHILTLMRPTLKEWIDGKAVSKLPTQELRCQECGKTVQVDMALARKGDYYCDGSDVFTYRQREPGKPSIKDIFTETFGIPDEAVASLRAIAANMRRTADALEYWIYMYAGVNEPPPDGPDLDLGDDGDDA